MTVFGQLKNAVNTRMALFRESCIFLGENLRFNASVGSDADPVKLTHLILREAHTLEKGMSLRSPRPGFGVGKAEHLLDRLETYAARYPYTRALGGALLIFRNYLDNSVSDTKDALETRFSSILAALENPSLSPAPSLLSIAPPPGGSFASVLENRHSRRYFSREPVSDEQILQALELARHTPSACNRQAWRTHVFSGEQVAELLRWQGGCRGFEEELPRCILVTVCRKAFLHYEMFQPYVDGGLYAMNLINALESLSLGTIPVSCGFHSWKLKELRRFGIPREEVPIVLIGVGHPEAETRVAASARLDLAQTNTFHP